jgi:DHA1 family bicyclomycin/chloramphenicol resistance-like MFS transporter
MTRPLPLWTLTALCCLAQSALTVYLPSAPAMALAFETSEARVQLLVASFMLPYAAALPFVGPVSDRFGRRPAILGGVLLFLVASLVSMAATTIEWLFAARALQGIGACAMMVLPRAVARDRATGADLIRAVTLMAIGQSTANIMAPLIGGFLHEWFGWQGSFGFSMLVAAAIVWPVLRLEESAHGGGAAGHMVVSYTILLRIRPVACNVLSNAFHSATFYAYIAAAPTVFMTVLGMSVAQFGVIPLLWGAGYSVMGLVLASWFAKTDDHRMIMIGNAITLTSAAAMVALSVAGIWNVVLLALPSLFMGVGQAFCMPRNYNLGLTAAPVEIAGATSALYGFAQYGFGSLAALASAAVPHFTPTPIGAIVLFWSVLGLIAYLAGGQPKRSPA